MSSYFIYPKQFRNAKIPIEKNRCFILMPFKENFDLVYGNIKKALNDNGFICNRADEIIGSKPIMNKVLNEILRAHYIIADLSGQNPNVFYELGIAHTFKEAENIILITQKIDDIPFDIRHINNIIYDPNNLKYLTSNVLQTLKDNSHFIEFQEALQQRNVINIIHDNKEGFIYYLQSNLGNCLPLATTILSGELNDCENKEIENYFQLLINLVNNLINSYDYEFLRGTMHFFFESLVLCGSFKITDTIVSDFFYGNLFSSKKIDESEMISYQMDLAIALASQRVKLNLSMKWIINYFSRTKSATIDLNRNKIERFLMISNDKVIENMLIDALFNENPYIREHLADIVGEKKLVEAGSSLVAQLIIEENYFTAASIISAIGKIEFISGGNAIMKWLSEREQEIIKSNQLFVFKHARIAFSKLDIKHQTSYLDEFDKKYNEYIKNYFIL